MTATDEDLLRAMSEGATAGRVLAALTEAGAEPECEGREGLYGPSIAIFGKSRTYRYLLTRRLAPGPLMTWVMLNPSTADAFADDPTVARCWRRAARLGFGGIAVLNLFALRSTDPREVRRHAEPVGLGNDACLRLMCRPGNAVVAAWGSDGTYRGRGASVAGMLTAAGVALRCLGTTGQGQPRHPLYVATRTPLADYAPPGSPA